MVSIDVSEEALLTRSPELLELLLVDRATGTNIIWATDHYAHLGPEFAPDREIAIPSITGPNQNLIQPRRAKAKARQWDRTKERAEVFTPAWLCNVQNNRIDEAWFGRADVFNEASAQSWVCQHDPIRFDADGPRTWQAYVDDRRLEVACGEAPYLVSRYDSTTGELISRPRRIGLLDRKLRVVTENAVDRRGWLRWAQRAFESVYGFEYQGDSLLLARENLLHTYIDYATAALGTEPGPEELLAIATIVSWNLWQMDGLTGFPPLHQPSPSADQLDLFGGQEAAGIPCVIWDWRHDEMVEYPQLARAGLGPT